MRKALKVLHTLASCGLIGGVAGYMLLLVQAPQDPTGYAVVRGAIALLCNYLLVPSMALALVSGLLAMAVHRPFQQLRWVWVKAALGIGTFEATLGLSQSKAGEAAALAARIAQGEDHASALAQTLGYEWHSLAAVMTLALVNVVVGVWRPILRRGAPSAR